MPQRLLLFLVWSCGFEQREKQCHHDQARGIFKTAQFPSGNWRFGIGHLAQIHWQVFPWIGRLESKRNRRFLFEGTECLSEGTEFCGDLRQIVHLIMELSRCEKKTKQNALRFSFRFVVEVLDSHVFAVKSLLALMSLWCKSQEFLEDVCTVDMLKTYRDYVKKAKAASVFVLSMQQIVKWSRQAEKKEYFFSLRCDDTSDTVEDQASRFSFFRWFSFMYCIW